MSDASELDALIVDHIVDIEAAQRRITDVIDPLLLKEAATIIESKMERLGWACEIDDYNTIVTIAPEEWVKRDEEGNVNWWFPWIEFSSIEVEGDLEHTSHLSDFLHLENSATCRALSFKQDVLGKTVWRGLLREYTSAVGALRALGFTVDERKGAVYLRVQLNAADLRRGFAEEGLEEALTPIGKALDVVLQAMPHFELLANAGRAKNGGMTYIQTH